MKKSQVDHQSEVQRTIAAVAAKIRKFKDQRIGESNTKSALIEPILRSLGWDISDPDEVHREFKPTSRDCPVDYALKLMRAPRLFIEAKDLGEDLTDRKWVAQMLGYAAVAGVEWCVLTNGDEYRFYNATAPIDADEKLFCSAKISRDTVLEIERIISLMTKDNLKENSLERHWKAHFVDRRVKTALKSLISDAESSLVRILRSRTSNLRSKDVVESLRRLEINIDVPPIFEARDRAQEPVGSDWTKPADSRAITQRSDVSLMDLINAGVLRAPLRLFKHYKKQMLEATLLADGQIEFRGKTFESCSTAAAAAIAAVIGQPKNTNGWTFWYYTDSTGKAKSLENARNAASKDTASTSAS